MYQKVVKGTAVGLAKVSLLNLKEVFGFLSPDNPCKLAYYASKKLKKTRKSCSFLVLGETLNVK